jgi:hypothetical protein
MLPQCTIATLWRAAMLKEQGKPKAKTKSKRLSKIAEWWLKHPEGSGLVIHDMRAVLR